MKAEAQQDAKRAKTEQQPAGAAADPMAVDDAAQQKDTAAATPPPAAAAAEPGTPPMRMLMAQYYRKLFPTQQMFRWLCYGNDGTHAAADGSFASRRELCFTLDGDIFVRYQSYKSASDLAADLARKVPSKIDIGPLYTHDPRQRAKYAKDFKPVQRELVIDIDMSDYDELRTCGSGGHICGRCWPFMAVAIEVLDAALRQDFGFSHILWVYSGRRGVHCWVADEGARALADDARAALTSYLTVIRGSEGGLAKLAIPNKALHPSLQRAQRMLEGAWRQHILPEQELLEEPSRYQALLRYVPDEGIVSRLTQRWDSGGQGIVAGSGGSGRRPSSAAAAAGASGDSCSLSVRRWDELVQEVTDEARRLGGSKASSHRGVALEKCLSDIVFAHTYPRLDAEVTKKMNHLLKAPFCVHPKTGKVCVPIDPAAAWDFDLEAVPTVQQLCQELATAAAATAQQQAQAQRDGEAAAVAPTAAAAAEGWRSTSLAPHIDAFADSFLAPLTAASKAALNERAKQAAVDQRSGRDMSW